MTLMGSTSLDSHALQLAAAGIAVPEEQPMATERPASLNPGVSGAPWPEWLRSFGMLALSVVLSMLVVVPATALLLRTVRGRVHQSSGGAGDARSIRKGPPGGAARKRRGPASGRPYEPFNAGLNDSFNGPRESAAGKRRLVP